MKTRHELREMADTKYKQKAIEKIEERIAFDLFVGNLTTEYYCSAVEYESLRRDLEKAGFRTEFRDNVSRLSSTKMVIYL